MSSLPALEARRGEIQGQIDETLVALTSAQANVTRLQTRLSLAPDDEKTAIRGNIATLQQEIARDSAQLNLLTQQLAQIDAEIATLRASEILPSQSTGETVTQAKNARDDAASTTNPPPGPETDENGRIIPTKPTVSTNAQRFQRNADAGTNAAARKNTQTIPPPTAAPGGAAPSGGEFAYPNDFPSANSPNDDNTNSNNVKAVLNQIFGSAQRIVAQENPLDKYASYTYNISIYMISPLQYKRMFNTKDRNLAGWQLLMQSGGAPSASGVTTSPQDLQYENFDAAAAAQQKLSAEGRNQFFPLDYYLDDLRIESLVQNKGTRSAHNAVEIRFKIYEPNGLSLFDRLYLAAKQVNGIAEGGEVRATYTAQNYLMVIKFYGYDDAGNLVRPTQKTGPNSDITSVIEKWIPFQFVEIKTRIANRITEYDCHAYTPQMVIAGGQMRGVIPYNVELTSTTIEQLLNGTSQFGSTTGATDDSKRTDTANQDQPAPGTRTSSTTSPRSRARLTAQQTAASAAYRSSGELAYPNETPSVEAQPSAESPAKADAAPKTQTLIKGLVDALNKYQADLCESQKPGLPSIYTYPDQYEIVIQEDILKSAKIIPPGDPDKSVKPMITAQTAADAKLGAKQSVNNDSQNKSIVAGTSIIQLIDQAVRNSTYISAQQLYNVDSSNGTIRKNGTPAQVVGWYHIGMEVIPLQYDPKREDYAYKIKYSVSPYAITETKSDWFPDSQYRGVQKKYNYWFTGENTQVLDYTQNLDFLYYVVLSGPSVSKDLAGYTDYREFDKRGFQTRSNETDQGSRNKTFEPAANLTEGLYSPYDTVQAKLTVVGDPDWIQQGEMAFGISETPNYMPFTPDNSINFDSQEPLFEILFNKPVDYDLTTGLMDPGQTNFYANRPEGRAGEARVSNVYRAFFCTSIFNRGKFTQELTGAQVRFNYKENIKPNDVSRTPAATGTPTLSGPEYTNFRKSEILQQNAAASKTSWAVGYANALPTGASQNSMAAKLATTAITPTAPAAPPTSGGQVVGPASSLNLGTGGAAGINVGQPVAVDVLLSNGEIQQVTSAAEIQALRQQGLVNPQAANSAANRLRIFQNAANNPITATQSQLKARENG